MFETARAHLSQTTICGIRIGLGLVCGLVLGFCQDPHSPLFDQAFSLTLGSFFCYFGLVLLSATGSLRTKSLILWGLISLCLIALATSLNLGLQSASDRSLRPLFYGLFSPALFILNEFVIAADKANRPLAPYEVYFEEAWKRILQLSLSVLFVGAFWLILNLGVLLFRIIGLRGFASLITDPYFAFISSFVVFALGVHQTDVMPTILKNIRSVLLNLLSFLLPLIAVIIIVFLSGLLFVGIDKLWATKNGANILIGTSLCLVILMNTAYQTGEDNVERTIWPPLKILTRICGPILLCLALLGNYAIWTRIDQYGLTPERCLAAVFLLIVTGYGLGYGFASLRSRPWMLPLEWTNLVMAGVTILLALGLCTPQTNPISLSVTDQLARLSSHRTLPDQFDYQFLATHSGQMGKEALSRLSKSSNPTIARRAKEALADTLASQNPQRVDVEKLPLLVAKSYGGPPHLPKSFVQHRYADHFNLPECLKPTPTSVNCTLILAKIRPDDREQGQVLILSDQILTVMDHTGSDQKTPWQVVGSYHLTPVQTQALLAGKLSTQRPSYDSLDLGDGAVEFRPNF